MKKLRSFWEKRSFLFKIRLILGLISLILVLLFLCLKIVLFGHITYSRTWPRGLASGKGFIYDFKPAERIDASSSSLRLAADPVYFSLYAPRAFDRAEITVKYRDRLATTTPIIEIGVLKDKLTGQYELQPLQNNIVDRYRFSWPRLEDSSDRLVLQTEKYYNDVSEFNQDLKAGNLKGCLGGPTSCVATYNYQLNSEFRLPDYVSLTPTVISQPLRGAHQFYVYFKSSSWRLAFNFVDLNLDKEQDPITVNVYSGDKIIAAKTLADNNPTPDNGQSEEKAITLSGQEASGLYRVEIKVSDDIVISKLESSSDKISFINKLWPVSGKGSLTLFTDASYLGVSTVNPVSLGEVIFAGKNFSLDKTYKQFYFQASSGANKIVLDKDDLVLENSGVFAFSSASLIDPGAKKVDRYFSASDNIKYIIAVYERPLENDGVKTARAALNLRGAVNEKNKYTFLISIPGLDGLAGAENYLDIQEIQIKLTGKTIFEKIKEILRK
ncbi:MAG: hypothetical protein WC719_03965 [Patescibacteria group bacterium]|jgi:hypothetical protein